MFPKICTIGPFTVYSFGLMMAVAVIVCLYLLNRDAQKAGIKAGVVVDLLFFTVLGGILGARIFFVLLNIDYFVNYPLEIVMINNGGIAWQGGLICGGLMALWLIRKKKLDLPKTADLVAPYIALGQAIGRIGCFLNGCCYGRHADWGPYFPVHDDHLHPTQLYDALGLLVIFFILKKFQQSPHKPGQAFVFYLFLAPALRFVVEFYRADHLVFFLGLSVFQWVCIGLILVAIYVNTRLKSKI